MYISILQPFKKGHSAAPIVESKKGGLLMVNTEVKVMLESGKEVVKRFVAGTVVRVNEEDGKPLSFDLVVNKGKDRDPEFINRIAVSRDAKFADLVRKFEKGQQLFCEINVVLSDKTDTEGNPYRNLWLQGFDYGRAPRVQE